MELWFVTTQVNREHRNTGQSCTHELIERCVHEEPFGLCRFVEAPIMISEATVDVSPQ
jgi:hypothetical protein